LNLVYITYQYKLPHVWIHRFGASKMPVLRKGKCFPSHMSDELQVTGWQAMVEEAKVCWQYYAKVHVEKLKKLTTVHTHRSWECDISYLLWCVG
jgi:hypothetical protein